MGYFIKGALPHRAWRYRDVAEGTLYAGAIWSPGGPATQICPALRRMYSKWYKPLVVQPKFTRRGKHSLTSSHLRQARTPPLDFGRRRGTVSFGPALPTGVDFQGSPPPGCVLASISSKAAPSHWCHHRAQWEPRKPGRAAARTSETRSTPPCQRPSYSGGSTGGETPATAMARTSRGVQIEAKCGDEILRPLVA